MLHGRYGHAGQGKAGSTSEKDAVSGTWGGVSGTGTRELRAVNGQQHALSPFRNRASKTLACGSACKERPLLKEKTPPQSARTVSINMVLVLWRLGQRWRTFPKPPRATFGVGDWGTGDQTPAANSDSWAGETGRVLSPPYPSIGRGVRVPSQTHRGVRCTL